MGKKRIHDVSDDEEAKDDEVVYLKKRDSSGNVEKPLPPGYVCNVCGSVEHAIYNCPNKIPKKVRETGTSEQKVEAKDKSVSSNKKTKFEDSSETTSKLKKSAEEKARRRVYMSGLPFDTDIPKLTEYLEKEGCEVDYVKLVTFEDNPTKCKGVAFVTFKSEEFVSVALQLDGRSYGNKTLHVEIVKDKKTSSSTDTKTKNAGAKRCYRCGAAHDPATCKNQRICYRCKSFDHLSSQCPLKKKEQ